jgi:hypothetical protein
MKKVMAILLSMLCAACTPVVTKVNVPDMAKSDSLSVRDVRPDNEKDRKLFSLLVSSKEYGIFREGDARLSPSPTRLLQHQVFEKFNVSGELPKVDVYHFVVYSNMKSKLRSNAVFAGIGGILGGLAANAAATHVAMASTGTVDEKMFDNWSGDNEYQRALFTEAENPTRAPVYIIYIDTDIDGKRVLTRTVSSIEQQGGESSLVTAVQLAITNHLGHYDTSVSTVEAAPTPPVLDAGAVAVSSAVVVSTPTQGFAANTAITPMAQGVANQLGCGVVKANGDSTYVAPCGDHGVVIDCDGGQCHPTHTVRIE